MVRRYGAEPSTWVTLANDPESLIDDFVKRTTSSGGTTVPCPQISAIPQRRVPTYGPSSANGLTGGDYNPLAYETVPQPIDRNLEKDLPVQSIALIARNVAGQNRFTKAPLASAFDRILVEHPAYPHVPPLSLAHALSPSSPFRCAGFSVVEGFRLVGNDPNEDFLSWLVHESRPWRVILPAVYQTENVTFSADQHVPAFSKHGVPYPTGSTVRLALQERYCATIWKSARLRFGAWRVRYDGV